MSGTFGGDFNLVVGRFSSDCQSKATTNTIVLSQILTVNELIRQTKYPPICLEIGHACNYQNIM